VLFLASLIVSPALAAPSNGRGYEMVSPPSKNGGDVISDSQRTRAAADGSAVGFVSLTGFAGNEGTGIASDYLAVRSAATNPGTNGWATHGTMPRMRPLSARALFAQVEPLYQGDFAPDLRKGLLFVWGALDGDPNVNGVANLYRNNDLRSTRPTFDLVSTCPLCVASSTPLPDYPPTALAISLRPTLADTSPDFDHVAFESYYPLTADAQAQSAPCDLTIVFPYFLFCHSRVYQWDNGSLSLAGRVPMLPAIECDDGNGAGCVPADVSIPGQGTGVSRDSSSFSNRVPNTVSDGSDGHTRVFFTQPTDDFGQTTSQLDNSIAVNQAYTGRVFMRVDARSTVQLDVSERTPDVDDPPEASQFSPSHYLDASADGRRVFFMSTAALTDDAPINLGMTKLYMYDTTKAASAPDNLTYLGPDDTDIAGVIGASRDGRYVYFVGAGSGLIYLWHDGTLRVVGPVSVETVSEVITARTNWVLNVFQARVTPDGRHLLFSSTRGDGLVGYDHGSCLTNLGSGCRELYLYSADDGALACASCNPSGAPATAMAMSGVWESAGAAGSNWHWNRAVTDDGSRVFFSTAERLVPEDVNGRVDAYEYAVSARRVHLISTGTDPSNSFFLDASADGRDVFFTTRERLVGWDVDSATDLYDARVGGRFPEPVAPLSCSGDPCQGDESGPPAPGTVATDVFRGAGNSDESVRPRHRKKRCQRGFVKKRVGGKVKCVKKNRHRRTRHRAALRSHADQSERRGS